MKKLLQLTAILILAAAILPLSANAQEQKPQAPAKAAPAARGPAARPAPAARVAPQQSGSAKGGRAATRRSSNASGRARRSATSGSAKGSRAATRPAKSRSANAPGRAAHAATSGSAKGGRAATNPQRLQLQRVRPHHAPLIHRLGQRRRRPATLCRPLQPQHQRARSCAASNARSAHYARKKLVSCEPFRLRSALRNSRKSISSVSSARSSGYSLTSRRSRKAWFSPMLKCSAACAATASRV